MEKINTTLVAPMAPPTLAEMSQDFAGLVALRSIMRTGVDFGTIPGCGDKPALFKPGAEKVLKRFMVHVTDIPVEDLSTADCIRYRVRCIGTTPDGVVRGVGIGECSTDEEKYRWRKAYDAEFNDTTDDRRRTKQYKNFTAKQVRTNPADLANTVLKMAKKRAMVDLALTATAASDFFTQDVEDMSPEMQAQVGAEHRARPADPFAPPVVDTVAEVVEQPAATPEPARIHPKRQIWTVAQELGLDGDDVAAVVAECGLSGNGDNWTVVEVVGVCDALTDRAAAPPAETTAEEAAPPQSGSFAELVDLCESNAHTAAEMGVAMDALGYSPETLPPAGVDEVLTEIERMKGA